MFGNFTFRIYKQGPGLQVLFFLMGLLFTGCGNSSLSSGPVVDPSQLRVNVNLSFSTNYDGEKHTQLEAFIQDKNGRAVANPQIVVKVNGVALRLNNGSSNYYGVYPHYQLTDNGAYTIPVAYLKSAAEPFNGLEIVLISDKSQGVNKAFREGSAISSHHSEMFRIDLTDNG